MKLFKNWHLIKAPILLMTGGFTKDLPIRKRSQHYMKTYFGADAIAKNERERPFSMTARELGFQDGYLACLKDLGLDKNMTRLPEDHQHTLHKK